MLYCCTPWYFLHLRRTAIIEIIIEGCTLRLILFLVFLDAQMDGGQKHNPRNVNRRPASGANNAIQAQQTAHQVNFAIRPLRVDYFRALLFVIVVAITRERRAWGRRES